jgi:hypothetical protein
MNKIILTLLLQITSLVLYSQELLDSSNIVISDTIHEMELNFIELEIVPTVPDCEILGTNKERIECLGNYMQKHVVKNFNFEMLDTLDLPEGRYTIYAVFVISKLGNIENIMVKASNQDLKNEAIRVLQLLPTMIPGQEKGGKYVSVRYALPITVMVEGNTPIKKKKRKK